jgi:hypothetical protein
MKCRLMRLFYHKRHNMWSLHIVVIINFQCVLYSICFVIFSLQTFFNCIVNWLVQITLLFIVLIFYFDSFSCIFFSFLTFCLVYHIYRIVFIIWCLACCLLFWFCFILKCRVCVCIPLFCLNLCFCVCVFGQPPPTSLCTSWLILVSVESLSIRRPCKYIWPSYPICCHLLCILCISYIEVYASQCLSTFFCLNIYGLSVSLSYWHVHITHTYIPSPHHRYPNTVLPFLQCLILSVLVNETINSQSS